MPDLRQALEESKARVGRVTTPEQILLRQARETSGMSQFTFAERIGTPVATLREIGSRAASRRRAQYCACCV